MPSFIPPRSCVKVRKRSWAKLGSAVAVLTFCCIPIPATLAQSGEKLPSRIFGSSQPEPAVQIIPPQALLQWNHSAQDITRAVRVLQEETSKALDQIGGLHPDDCTFESVFLALELLETRRLDTMRPLLLYRGVSPSKELRDASKDAKLAMEEFKVQASMRMDVFIVQVAAENNIRTSGRWETLLPEERRLVTTQMLQSNALAPLLPVEKQDELKQLRTELEQVTSDFNRNLAKERGISSLSDEDFGKVPRSMLKSHTTRTTEDGKNVHDVTLKPSNGPIDYATKETLRQLVSENPSSRLLANVALMDRAIELRGLCAQLLGYNDWVDFKTEGTLGQSAQNVQQFLDDIEAKLRPVALRERDILLELKRRDHEANGLDFDGAFYAWDYAYYGQQLQDLNITQVQEYFPVPFVVPAILDIYANLLGLRIDEITNASTWHPDVRTYAVWEKDTESEKDFLGYFYLDLFARDGKESTATLLIHPDYERPDGSRSHPVSALQTNFAPAEPTRPALLQHSDVVTFFHEMGHIFYDILCRVQFSRFHGNYGADTDFMEIPSKMLENWVWEPTVLEKISSHYESREPLPGDLLQKLGQSRSVHFALSELQNVFYAKFDLQVHRKKCTQDHGKLFLNLRRDVALLDYKKEVPDQIYFNHITSGYDAAVYGYVMGRVFAADMYASVFKHDPLSPVSGRLYRDKVLRVGGSRDSVEILKDFLGHEPNSQAYFDWISTTQTA